MRDILRLIRPKQWAKNLLVFAGLIFTGQATQPDKLGVAMLAFAAMCLVSSAVYVANDLLDRDRDRNHPTKKDRPIASGRVPAGMATGLAALLVAGGAGIGAYLGTKTLALIGLYLGLQVLYNLSLKRIAVADVFTIALGFVLRAGVGAAAIDVKISPWLLLCAGSLSLTLGFGKRRSEFMELGGERDKCREALSDYTERSLDFLVAGCAIGSALTYGLYAIESPTGKAHPGLFFTTIFVFYGVCRYLLVLFRSNEGAEPENLLFRDKHILASVVLFIITAVIVMQKIPIPLLETAR